MHIELFGGGKIPQMVQDIMSVIVVISAIVAAYITIFLGQIVTKDAAWTKGRLPFLMMLHRIGFWCFALALFFHAKEIALGLDVPDVSDLLVYGSMMVVCVLSALRHRMAPQMLESEQHPPFFLLSRH